ncbi:MAG: hypothetical protein H6739_11645 [Alphaproteobacteria bacterium]|nr:hypothetical protein [Alphaproteobacteria bacterium]
MSVDWPPDKAEQIDSLIDAHPVESGRCASLARSILPIAREQDADAQGVIVKANAAQTRYPCMKPRIHGVWWFHHVTLGVEGHFVDALTGTQGTERAHYLTTHFSNAPGELRFDESDPDLEQTWL